MTRPQLEAILPPKKHVFQVKDTLTAHEHNGYNKAYEEILTALLAAGVGVVPSEDELYYWIHVVFENRNGCIKAAKAIRALWLGEDK